MVQPLRPTLFADLNSWAVLTAFRMWFMRWRTPFPGKPWLDDISRLMLTAETSCYWYWTGQHVWDQQVTNATNAGYAMVKSEVDALLSAGKDRTGPTIFAPWVTRKIRAASAGGRVACWTRRARTVHTFVHDIAGLKRVTLVLRAATGETRLAMTDNGPYPSQTGAVIVANYLHR